MHIHPEADSLSEASSEIQNAAEPAVISFSIDVSAFLFYLNITEKNPGKTAREIFRSLL